STMRDLRVDCFKSLLQRPMAYFDRANTSAAASSVLLAQQPPIAIAIVHNAMSYIIENVFSASILAVGTFVVCVPNGIVGLVYIVIFFTSFLLVEHYSNKAYNEVVEIDKSGELAMEIFDNVATIQQLAVESHFQHRFDEIQMRRRTPLAKKIRCFSLVHAISSSERMFLDFMAMSVGVYFVYTGFIDVKQLYATQDIIQASSAAR
ncbi:hypothetical protein PMAYCL1PPCAC_19145, partial [Pristionchus mayeri]